MTDFHKIGNNLNITLDQLQLLIHRHDHYNSNNSNINSNNSNINHNSQQMDDLGKTALHLLCLNPNATREMMKILANACPQVANKILDGHQCPVS